MGRTKKGVPESCKSGKHFLTIYGVYEMIFITVGTHEQQFNRLIKEMDDLKGSGAIAEDVVIQIGYSTYEPVNCCWSKFFSYNEMIAKVNQARIVITHGGPASFLMPLQVGKVPIVVPRIHAFNEHVNDHQVEFVRLVSERMRSILPVFDICQLEIAIKNYSEIILEMNSGMTSNNSIFNEKFRELTDSLFVDDDNI